MTFRQQVLDRIPRRGDITADTIGRYLRTSTRLVVGQLNDLRAEGLVVRRVGDPNLPPGRDRGIARWSRA